MALYVVMRAGFAPVDVAEPHQPAAQQVENCEALFWALDGRELVVLGRRWRIEVFSVVELAGRRYMQLSLDGPSQYMLTLRLTPGTSVRRLIPTVLTWLTHPAGSGEVIDVE